MAKQQLVNLQSHVGLFKELTLNWRIDAIIVHDFRPKVMSKVKQKRTVQPQVSSIFNVLKFLVNMQQTYLWNLHSKKINQEAWLDVWLHQKDQA